MKGKFFLIDLGSLSIKMTVRYLVSFLKYCWGCIQSVSQNMWLIIYLVSIKHYELGKNKLHWLNISRRGTQDEIQRAQIFNDRTIINKTQVLICWSSKSYNYDRENTKLETKKDPQGKVSGMNRKEETCFLEQTNQDDDEIIFDQYLQRGPKWREICQYVKGKSQNSVKNKFYGALRKFLRKVNEVGKRRLKKFSKPITYDALVRVVEVKWRVGNLPYNLQLLAEDLALKSINFCRSLNNLQSQDTVIEYIRDFLRFNLQSRCYRLKKRPKNQKQNKKTEKSRLLTTQEMNVSSKKISTQHYYPSQTKKDCNSFSSSNPGASNIIKNGRTQQNILNPKEQEYLQIDEIQINRIMKKINSFEGQFCGILGIQYTPSSCLLQQFF